MTTRRTFIGAGAALFGMQAAGATAAPQPATRKLDLLFLGGTGFIGPHQINFALARGHRVTMFNRGRNAGLYGDRVEELTGNRDDRIGDGLAALEGDRRWDVVIDNSGYLPRHVRDSAELLEGRCERYLYTSTVAVYDFDRQERFDHTGPLAPAPDPATEDVNGETYGPLKAECDRIVQAVYGDAATIVRPTYIVGPGDHTDRFTYWVERFQRGGDIVCPPSPDRHCDWIDVRDLCHWMIRLAEDDRPGIFNGSGPATPVTREQVMWGFRLTSAAPVALHWPGPELVAELGFPTPMFFTSERDFIVDAAAARGAGLTYRSFAETVRDCHDWWRSQSAERRARPRGWPSAEQERAVLERLRG